MFASLSTFSSLLTSAAVLSALAFAPGCSSGDVPIGQDGTSTRNGSGSDPSDGGGAGDGGEGTTACTTNADCGAQELCGFRESDECLATGRCFAQPEVGCGAQTNACACDGTQVSISCNGLPVGYASKPTDPTNAACANHDGGSAPKSCTAAADCGSDQACAYEESLGCTASGVCVDLPLSGCNAIELVCACDGSAVNAVCNGLSGGYANVPVTYPLDQSCGKP